MYTEARKKPRLMRAEATTNTATPEAYLPHEIVTDILTRLPVKSLLRFRCVCKAWRRTISDDPAFVRAHLHHQPSTLLVLPLLGEDDEEYMYMSYRRRRPPSQRYASNKKKIAFYRWAPSSDTVATLVHAADMLTEHNDVPHHDALPHCDGLVLVPAGDKVHLFNPAARQAVALPWSPGSVAPLRFRLRLPRPHQALGLGHDPRSGTYKAARFFYREVFAVATSSYALTTGMEVLTVGADSRWRELTEEPPYPAIPDRAATFHKGSLLWTVDERFLPRHGAAAPGFLRFSLEDESFGVTPAPPCHPRLDYASSNLTELRGELCVARMEPNTRLLELWMTDDAVHPRWDRRYAIHVMNELPRPPRPVAMLDDGILFHDRGFDDANGFISVYDFKTRVYKDTVQMNRLKYHGDGTTTTIDYPRPPFSYFFLLPYCDSLHVLEHGEPHERSAIIEKLIGQIVQMSQQKFASNVIEKCLAFGNPVERQILIGEMLGSSGENEHLEVMMKDQFANYVVQKVLETCDDQQREMILTRIKAHLNTLKKYTYGKHIVARVEKLVAAGEKRLGLQPSCAA